jgi:nucleotide-binding universal stress UspA family protein
MSLFSRILIAYDGSPGSERSLDAAVHLASEQKASLLILSVVEGVPRFAGTIDEVDDAVRSQNEALTERQGQARRKAEEYGVTEVETEIRVGHAAQLIVEAAGREHADLLVLGRSGHSQVWGRFMGSTADKIVRHVPCSVFIAH